MKTEKDLFQIVDKLGEMLNGYLHIIDTTDTYPVEGEKSYRIYHKQGICFDIKKEVEIEDEDGEVTKWGYDFYSEWGGFNNDKTIDEMYKLIKNETKKRA